MRIACDNCHTGYDVNPSVLGTQGRMVRCSNCKSTWFARPVSDDVIDVAPDSKEPILKDGMAVPQRQSFTDTMFKALRSLSRKTSKSLDQTPSKKVDFALSKRRLDLLYSLPQARMRRNITVLGVGVLSSVFIACFVFSNNIVRTIPDLASFYQAIGVNVNARNIAFEQVTSEVQHINGKPTLVVKGQLRNIASKDVALPNIKVSLLAEYDKEIYTWAVQPTMNQLSKGETIDFETLLVSPPQRAQAVEVIFEML